VSQFPAPRPALPAELAALKEVHPGGVIQELGSLCLLHGPQTGGNCPECDKYFPDQVKARSQAGPATVAMSDVQALIDAAVKAAVQEAMAFQNWKNSPEGQDALAAKQATSPPPLHPAAITEDPNKVT
jgi:hypothetical protein